MTACGSCGTDLRDSAKFCDECGAATTTQADTATYRQVTVLFADVVRSMDIAAALDIERLREVMTELVQRSAAVVQRYGGTVEYNGDGVMALFGAPVTLEDHALRGCLAALAIQQEAGRLADEVARLDGVVLELRVGLNSGRVIAGEIGSGPLGYVATGETVGFAQRMESAAPPGGVMLSESTARLVEHAAVLGEPESVRIKGADDPVSARRLLAVARRDDLIRRAEANLVGRRWEMAALDAMMERAIGGHGGVVTVVGPPGIGKSRVARELAALAAGRGVRMYGAFCESHAYDLSFGVVAQLLRAATGVADLEGAAARARVRVAVVAADTQDLLLLDDLLGIANPDVPLPQIDPDARRRRLNALISATSLARTEPALFVIEDAHWIDAISESMLADLLAVIAGTPSVVLITARPEYGGTLIRIPGAHTISLGPLGDSDIAALLTEMLGTDLSIEDLATVIADRAAGNPFFAQEIVRELVQRGVLTGERGGYRCDTSAAEVTVPATVQAAIAARIDRLDAAARQTLHAASAIGEHFTAELLVALGVELAVEELLFAELIDQVGFTPSAEYTFHHPLIRAVAYESQLKADRARWHRHLAAAVQEREPGSVEENAALIAEHLQAAGELLAAYGWHMRAAAWSTIRDLDAARLSWERARSIADEVPGDDPSQLAMRIAPRTMLCATSLRGQALEENRARFADLRELCEAAGDQLSLAIGMTGLVAEVLYAGHAGEASRLASEQTALLESIGEPGPTVGSSFPVFCTWLAAGELGKTLRWSQNIIDLADGDPTRGSDFGLGSPLSAAIAFRGAARWWLGRPGWRQDIHDALEMVQHRDATTRAGIVAWTYGFAIQYGVLVADDSVVRACEEVVQTAAAAGNDMALGLAEYTLAVGLLNQAAPADRHRGVELMAEARGMWLRDRALFLLPVIDAWAGRERAGRGDRDAIPVMREAVDELHGKAQVFYGIWATGVLIETLLESGDEADLGEAEERIGQLANWWADTAFPGSPVHAVMLLRLRALLARARGDDTYPDLVRRYSATAESMGFEGHLAWAQAMAEVMEQWC